MPRSLGGVLHGWVRFRDWPAILLDPPAFCKGAGGANTFTVSESEMWNKSQRRGREDYGKPSQLLSFGLMKKK
jgi:hypothetical protein